MMKMMEIKILTIGDEVTAQTVDRSLKTGIVTTFGQHVVIISCGAYRYTVRKSELKAQGYRMPPYKKHVHFALQPNVKRA